MRASLSGVRSNKATVLDVISCTARGLLLRQCADTLVGWLLLLPCSNWVTAAQFPMSVGMDLAVSCFACPQARVAPVKKALAGLAALEAQVDALGGLMGHLEMESKVLARQVGVE